MGLAKPPRWNVNPALLAPKYRKLWNGLVAVFPMWAGAGNVQVFGPKAYLFPANTLGGGAVWTRAEHGIGIDDSSGTSGTGIALGTADPISEGNWSLVFAGRLDVLPGSNDWTGFIVKKTDGSTQRWQWFIERSEAGNTFGLNNDGTGAVAFTVVPSLGYHVWMVTDDGTDCRIYEDGVLLETVSGTLTFAASPGADMHIGRNIAAGTENFEGVIDCAYIFERVLSDAEGLLIGRDVHGLFRMNPLLRTSITFFQTLLVTAVLTATNLVVMTAVRTLSVTAIGTATLSKTSTFLRTLSVIAMNSATMAKKMFLTLVVTAVNTAALTKAKTLLRTLSVTAVASATLSPLQVIGQSMAVTAVATATLAKVATFSIVANVTAVVTATLQRFIQFTMGVTAVGTATLSRVVTRFISMSVTALGVPTLSKVKTLKQSMAVTALAVVTLVTAKTFARLMSVTAIVTATLSKVFIDGGGAPAVVAFIRRRGALIHRIVRRRRR